MIIDRIIENGLNLVHPGTVVTSPVYLGSFYQDTSPATEINNSLCAPNEFDGWGKVGSPTPPTADSATNGKIKPSLLEINIHICNCCYFSSKQTIVVIMIGWLLYYPIIIIGVNGYFLISLLLEHRKEHCVSDTED
jgi:hypothetical protein